MLSCRIITKNNFFLKNGITLINDLYSSVIMGLAEGRRALHQPLIDGAHDIYPATQCNEMFRFLFLTFAKGPLKLALL